MSEISEYVEGAAKGIVLGVVESVSAHVSKAKERKREQSALIVMIKEELNSVFSRDELFRIVHGVDGLYGLAYFGKPDDLDELDEKCAHLREEVNEKQKVLDDCRALTNEVDSDEAIRLLASIDDFENNFFSAVVELVNDWDFSRLSSLSASVRERPYCIRLHSVYSPLSKAFSDWYFALSEVLSDRIMRNPFF